MIRGYRKLPTGSNELTRRQREVAALLMRGYNHKQICAQLAISQSTVGCHIGEIYRKLGATSKIEVMAPNMPLRMPTSLTKRQIEIIHMLATGKQNKEIARLLTVTNKTVDRHLCNIYAKLGVASRAEAVARCVGIQP